MTDTENWILFIYSELLITECDFNHTHLADTFIQSDLHCIQVTISTFYQLLLSLGIEPMILALLTPCSTSWATGKDMLNKLYLTYEALTQTMGNFIMIYRQTGNRSIPTCRHFWLLVKRLKTHTSSVSLGRLCHFTFAKSSGAWTCVAATTSAHLLFLFGAIFMLEWLMD